VSSAHVCIFALLDGFSQSLMETFYDSPQVALLNLCLCTTRVHVSE
jgi:hypothetical protein